ncbi:MAG TPA: HD domain-containing protein [Longimicrobiales bacterium]|nr:HD domain-containing protein [Longimicrobiales bacterium]
MSRVADLMGEWAEVLGVPAADRVRWRAAGYLHDCLRDAPVGALRAMVPETFDGLNGRLLHGPAAAARLRQDGVADEPLLLAITWHTTGHPDLDRLGRCLYIADFIEPGRRHEPVQLARLRERMPADVDGVLRDVLQMRIAHVLREQRPLRSETAAFWSAVNARTAATGNPDVGC